MIQTALIFILGFLVAGFLAVLIAPAIWRRAVLLTRRRLEAALPLSMAEISADKDAVRAEYAMTARRLEMTIKSLRQEIIEQSLAIERAESETRDITQTLTAAETVRTSLEERGQELERDFEKAKAEVEELSAVLAGSEQRVTQQLAELESLGAMYDEASFAASNRQIELVAQEANIENMREEISALNEMSRQTETQLRDAGLQNSAQDRALSEEKRRSATLEQKNSELVSALSDVQERLERREREAERLRGKGRQQQPDDIDDAAGIALLRERIKDLAAQMVSLTVQVEGSDSEIHQLLAKTSEVVASEQAAGQSLAQRIRALQKQAGTARQAKI